MAGSYRDGYVPDGEDFALKGAKPDWPPFSAEEVDWLAAVHEARRVSWFWLMMVVLVMPVAFYLDGAIWLFAIWLPLTAWVLWARFNTYAQARSIARLRARGGHWQAPHMSDEKSNSPWGEAINVLLFGGIGWMNFTGPTDGYLYSRWIIVVMAVSALWSLGKRLHGMWRTRRARAAAPA